MRAACEQVGAPADLVQSLPAPSLPKTQELMRQADLVVATGGAGMVRAAYSSGTPAYGVGVGNAVHVVDETADLADAAAAIMTAKTFDYATSCLAGQRAGRARGRLRRAAAAAHRGGRAPVRSAAEGGAAGGDVAGGRRGAGDRRGGQVGGPHRGLAGFGVGPGCPMLLVEEQGTGPGSPVQR
jgi:sulfoacetaldehyde dehydrogenase